MSPTSNFLLPSFSSATAVTLFLVSAPDNVELCAQVATIGVGATITVSVSRLTKVTLCGAIDLILGTGEGACPP